MSIANRYATLGRLRHWHQSRHNNYNNILDHLNIIYTHNSDYNIFNLFFRTVHKLLFSKETQKTGMVKITCSSPWFWMCLDVFRNGCRYKYHFISFHFNRRKLRSVQHSPERTQRKQLRLKMP